MVMLCVEQWEEGKVQSNYTKIKHVWYIAGNAHQSSMRGRRRRERETERERERRREERVFLIFMFLVAESTINIVNTVVTTLGDCFGYK